MLYDVDSNSNRNSSSSDIAGIMFFAPRSKLNIQREFQLYDGGSLVRETIGILQGALHQKNVILFRRIVLYELFAPDGGHRRHGRNATGRLHPGSIRRGGDNVEEDVRRCEGDEGHLHIEHSVHENVRVNLRDETYKSITCFVVLPLFGLHTVQTRRYTCR